MSSKPTPSPASLLGMGVSMAVCVLAGIGGGYWLDQRLKTGVVLTFVGLAVGIAVAAISVRAQIKRQL